MINTILYHSTNLGLNVMYYQVINRVLIGALTAVFQLIGGFDFLLSSWKMLRNI